ncbi:hypothetical protein AB4X15_12905 [Peribacillus simplex]
MSAGWIYYCRLLGNRLDVEFSESKISNMLDSVKNTIHDSPERTKSAMSNFLFTVGITYLPHQEKVSGLQRQLELYKGQEQSSFLNVYEKIQKEVN